MASGALPMPSARHQARGRCSIHAGDRSVVVTLGQANTIAEQFPADLVGDLDAYHVWWDPAVHDESAAPGGRTLGFVSTGG
jgi:hypothetical protein